MLFTVVGRKTNRVPDRQGGSSAGRIQRPERHQLNLPADAGGTQTVVSDCTDRGRDMAAMMLATTCRGRIVINHRIAGVEIDDVYSDKVAAMIWKTGAAAVPHIGRQILMGIFDTGIDHGHDNRAAIVNMIPGLHGIDIQTGYTRVTTAID